MSGARASGLTVEITQHRTRKAGWYWLDALALAAEDQPDLIVDFATLTGAARVGAGAGTAAHLQR